MIVFFVFCLFRPGPLCRACVRATHSVSVIRTLETCGLLLVVISCPQSARLFLVVQSLSHSRAFFHRVQKPCYESGLLDIRTGWNCVFVWDSCYLGARLAAVKIVARDVRVSFFYFFFVRVSVFYRYNIISFVRLLLLVRLSPFRSLSFSPSTERPNVT